MQPSHSVSHAEAHIWNPSGLPDWLARRLPVESQPPAAGPDGVILRAPPTAPSLSLSLSYSSSPEKWSSGLCLPMWCYWEGRGSRDMMGRGLTHLQNVETAGTPGAQGPLTTPDSPTGASGWHGGGSYRELWGL